MADLFHCSIALSKTGGITVTVEDPKGTITQTIAMDGTFITTTIKTKKSTSTVTQHAESLELKVKGDKETSTVTQKQDSVTVKCKAFTVDAETVEVKSSKDSTYDSKAKLTMKSAEDMTISSSAKSTVSSTAAMKISTSDALTVSATSDAKVSAVNITLDASAKLVGKGGTEAAISAMKVGLKGTAQLEAAAPITNLGQDVTSVKGKLVKIEGMAVKIG